MIERFAAWLYAWLLKRFWRDEGTNEAAGR